MASNVESVSMSCGHMLYILTPVIPVHSMCAALMRDDGPLCPDAQPLWVLAENKWKGHVTKTAITGLLSRYPILESSHCNSTEDRTPMNFIYKNIEGHTTLILNNGSYFRFDDNDKTKCIFSQSSQGKWVNWKHTAPYIVWQITVKICLILHTRQNISDRHFISSMSSDKFVKWW